MNLATSLTSEGPLTAAHRHELMLARARMRPIRNAARIATFNIWVTGIFAALSAPFAVLSVTGFLTTVALVAVAYNEYRGRGRLLAGDPAGAIQLGWNQIGFVALIVTYCAWMLHNGLAGDSPFLEALAANPELQAAGGEFSKLGDHLYRLCLVAVYGAVIIFAVAIQGLNAIYYFSRRKWVEKYVTETPSWVRNLQRLANCD